MASSNTQIISHPNPETIESEPKTEQEWPNQPCSPRAQGRTTPNETLNSTDPGAGAHTRRASMGSSQSQPSQTQRRALPRQRGRFSSSSSSAAAKGVAPPVMPSFFSFQQGSENVQNIRYGTEASPLLGRFRAVPRPSELDRSSPRRARSANHVGLLSAGYRGSVHVGYGALIAAELEAEDDGGDGGDDEFEDDDDFALSGWSRTASVVRWLRRRARDIDNTWVNPKASAVKRTVDVWYTRWGALVVLPAVLVRCISFSLDAGCRSGSTMAS